MYTIYPETYISAEIGGVFHDSGWIVMPFKGRLVSSETPVYGFSIEIRDKVPASKRKLLRETTRKALAILDDRIKTTTGGNDPEPGMNLDLVILVGSK